MMRRHHQHQMRRLQSHLHGEQVIVGAGVSLLEATRGLVCQMQSAQAQQRRMRCLYHFRQLHHPLAAAEVTPTAVQLRFQAMM